MRAIKAPCPGCREPNKYRRSDEVCGDCKALLAEAEQMRKMIEKRASTNMAAVRVPWSHCLPYIAYCDRDTVQKPFIELALAIGDRLSVEVEVGDRWRYTTQSTCIDVEERPLLRGQSGGMSYPIYLIPRKAAEAIEQLYTAIQAATDAAYKKGHHDGRQLLMNLHSGDITLKELEERIGIEDKPFDAVRARR